MFILSNLTWIFTCEEIAEVHRAVVALLGLDTSISEISLNLEWFPVSNGIFICRKCVKCNSGFHACCIMGAGEMDPSQTNLYCMVGSCYASGYG